MATSPHLTSPVFPRNLGTVIRTFRERDQLCDTLGMSNQFLRRGEPGEDSRPTRQHLIGNAWSRSDGGWGVVYSWVWKKYIYFLWCMISVYDIIEYRDSNYMHERLSTRQENVMYDGKCTKRWFSTMYLYIKKFSVYPRIDYNVQEYYSQLQYTTYIRWCILLLSRP